MAFSDEENPRRRKPRRASTANDQDNWPRKDQPLSWAMLPPEEPEEEEEDEEKAPAAPSPTTAPPTAAPAPGEDWKSRYQYLMADFENFRRRVSKESENAVAGARGKILLKVVGLYENVQLALKSVPADATAMRDGLNLILRNFDTFLREEGVEPVAKPGDKFQHELHEAVGELPVSPSAPQGTVAAVVQQGYRGPSGLLRPAKVLVASGK